MKRNLIALVIIALGLIGGIAWFGLGGVPQSTGQHVVSGYSGLVASFSDIEHDLGVLAEETILGTEAVLEPLATKISITGVRAEVGQPAQYETRIDWSDSGSYIDEDAGLNITEFYEAHIVTLRMGLTVYTTGTGFLPIQNVYFIVHLAENSFSVFQDATESAAFIIEVRTYDETDESDINLVDVSPAAGGKAFDLTSVGDYTVPTWMKQSGYTGNLQYFKEVEFPIHVIDMAPSYFFWVRTETQATFYIEIDCLLFGYWEVERPYVPWVPPEIPDLLGDLIAFLIAFVWYIVGLACTIVILWKVRPLRYAVIGVVIIWLLLAVPLGWLDPLLEVLGV